MNFDVPNQEALLQARQPYGSQTAANEARACLAAAPHRAFNVAVNETALRELQEADREFHLHPFTNHIEMHNQGTQVIVSADGCYLTDGTGRRLLDRLAGLWCVNVGYGRRAVIEAVHQQASRLPYYCS